jgi:hypothetical protein
VSPQEPCWRLGGRAWSCEESGGGCECSRGDMLPPEGFGLCEGARRTQNRILSAVVCVVQKVCDFSWSRLPVRDPTSEFMNNTVFSPLRGLLCEFMNSYSPSRLSVPATSLMIDQLCSSNTNQQQSHTRQYRRCWIFCRAQPTQTRTLHIQREQRETRYRSPRDP